VSKPRSAVITPSAARLTESLRDIGYDFPAAVADIVDNSVMAGASQVDVVIEFAGEESYVAITDDGAGMTANGLLEALRFGSRRTYGRKDLGRYGLGLKTASLSQCRSVTVATSRRSDASGVVTVRTLDLDLIAEWDEWLVVEPPEDAVVAQARERVINHPGTVVIWGKLDRVLPEKRRDGGWARRRLDSLAAKAAEHLGIVFHRYLESADRSLVITVNGQKVRPWNPFAPDEPTRSQLPVQRFEIVVGDVSGAVTLQRYVLPARHEFSSHDEFERFSGPLNWNRQQGLYVYRADRLVQWGGWNGIRGIDEHTKLARAALDFDTDLDSVFNINVAKMRVALPPQIRQMVEKPINELCASADHRYRKSPRYPEKVQPSPPSGETSPRPASDTPSGSAGDAGLALRAAAMVAGEYEAFRRIIEVLNRQAPGVASTLGLIN
jgi:hypothetical protein